MTTLLCYYAIFVIVVAVGVWQSPLRKHECPEFVDGLVASILIGLLYLPLSLLALVLLIPLVSIIGVLWTLNYLARAK